jgi:hypothetical protein
MSQLLKKDDALDFVQESREPKDETDDIYILDG